jgi:hypothetical protein
MRITATVRFYLEPTINQQVRLNAMLGSRERTDRDVVPIWISE